MKLLSGKKIFIVCSDPGAAQAVLLLPDILKKDGVEVTVIARNFGARITRVKHIALERNRQAYGSVHQISAYLTKKRPNFLVTGTSLKDDLEHNYLHVARHLQIPTFAYVDWWTNFKERFTIPSTRMLAVPDWVGVVDQVAAQGIRRVLGRQVRTIITGHPYLARVTAQKPFTLKARRALYHTLRLPQYGKNILFLPEPTAPPTGFDQFRIFQAIMQELVGIVGEYTQQINLILKFHPNGQQPELVHRYKHIVTNYAHPHIHVRYILNKPSVLELIEISNLVWGMNTTPLLEAMLRGKLVSSFTPNVYITGIPFSKSVGFCPSADSYAGIKRIVRALLTNLQFVRKAGKLQRRYQLPKDNFIERVRSLLYRELR